MRAIFAAIIALILARSSDAQVLVWDYSPARWGERLPNLLSHSSGQNYAERVLFPDSTEIVAMDVYGSPSAVGTSMTVRIWDDDAGRPGALRQEFLSVINLVDNDGASTPSVRKRAFFPSAVTLASNTAYWIGMSATDGEGTFVDFGQVMLASVPPGGDGAAARMHVHSLEGMQPTGDMAFRLYTVPEPMTATLLAASLLPVCFAVSRRQRRTGRCRNSEIARQ